MMAHTSLIMTAIDKISPATKSASDSQQKLEEQLGKTRKEASEINKTLKNVTAYEKQRSSLQKLESASKRYNKQLSVAKKEMDGLTEPTKDQIDALAILEQKVTDTAIAMRDKGRQVDRLGTKLKEASIDTDNLADAQRRLERRSEGYTAEIKKQSKELRTLAIAQKDSEKTRGINSTRASNAAKAGLVAASAGGLAATMSEITQERAEINFKNVSTLSASDNEKAMLYAQALAGSREGAGLTVSEIYKFMEGSILSGAQSLNEVMARTDYAVKISSTSDKERFDTWEVNKQMKRLFALDGMTVDHARNFTGAALQMYHGDDPDDFYDGFTEVRPRMDAVGFDSNAAELMVLALSKNNMTGSEASSTLEAMAEFLTIADQATDAQRDAMAKIGMTPERVASMVKTDFHSFIKTITPQLLNKSDAEQLAITESMFGTGFQTILKVIKDGSIDKAYALLNSGNAGSVLDERATNNAETMASGVTAISGSLAILAHSVIDPLTEDINTAMNAVADGIKWTASVIDELPEEVVKFTAGLTALSLAVLASGKTLAILGAGRSLITGGSVAGGIAASGASTAMGAGATLLKGAGYAGLVATLYTPVEWAVNKAIGDTDAAKWAKSTTLGDVWNSITGNNQNDELSKNSDLDALSTPLPISTATIPTVAEFEKSAVAKAAEESTRTVNLNLTIDAKSEGLTVEAQSELVREATRVIQEQLSGHDLDSREGY